MLISIFFSIPSNFSAHFLSWPHLKLPCTSEASVCFVTLPVFITTLPEVPFVLRLSCTIFLTSFSLVAYLGLLLWQHNLTWFQHYLPLMLYLLLDLSGAEFTTFYIPRALESCSSALLIFGNSNSSFLQVGWRSIKVSPFLLRMYFSFSENLEHWISEVTPVTAGWREWKRQHC